MHGPGGGFVNWASLARFLEKLAQLLPQRQPSAVQAALYRGHRQIEGAGDVLVGEPVHVLEEEYRPIILGKLRDGLVDGRPQLRGHHPLVCALRPVAERWWVEVAFCREPGARQLERLLAERVRGP